MGGTLKHTADGFESHIAANHIGHHLLCRLLLPQLQRQARPRSAAAYAQAALAGARAAQGPAGVQAWPCRLIVLSSVAHEWGDKWLDLDDLHFSGRKYHDMGAYAQSKLANLLFVRELTTRCASLLGCQGCGSRKQRATHHLCCAGCRAATCWCSLSTQVCPRRRPLCCHHANAL